MREGGSTGSSAAMPPHTTTGWIAWSTARPGWKEVDSGSGTASGAYAFLWGWGIVTCRAQASADLVRLPRHAPH